MRQQRQKFSTWFSHTTGMDYMGDRYQTLTYIYFFLIFYTTIESVFVNTLLHRIAGDMSYVILYRGISYVSSAIFMNVAAAVSQRSTPVFVLRLGGVFYLMTFASLVFGMNHMEQMRFIIPILSGAGGAFYWSGHNSLVLAYSDKSNRDLGLGILGVIQGITTLALPPITGLIISVMPGDWGYRLMFAVGMVFVVIQLFYANRLAPIPVPEKSTEGNFKKALRLAKKETTVQLMLAYEMLRGMRDGVFAFILNILLFEIIANEALTGVNTFLTGVASIIAAWAYGKFVRPSLRARYMALSTTILLAFASILFFKTSIFTVMLFTAINAFFTLFLINCGTNTSYDITAQSKEAEESNREIYGLREISIGIGRVLGLILISLLPQTQTNSIIVICILTGVQYLGALLVKKATNLLEDMRVIDENLANEIV